MGPPSTARASPGKIKERKTAASMPPARHSKKLRCRFVNSLVIMFTGPDAVRAPLLASSRKKRIHEMAEDDAAARNHDERPRHSEAADRRRDDRADPGDR